MSSAVVTCLGSGRPEALTKRVRCMPSPRARTVISAANASSEPLSASATTTATSLADLIAMAWAASFTLMVEPALRPSRDGGREAAVCDTGSSSSRESRPVSTASNSRNSVIILVSDAGKRSASASSSNSDFPVTMSAT